MDESTLINVFNMMIERLGKVEDSQQELIKSNEDVKRKLFATFVHSGKHCRLDTFFTDLCVPVWVSEPTNVYSVNSYDTFEIYIDTKYSKDTLTIEIKKNIGDILPYTSIKETCYGDGYSYISIMILPTGPAFGLRVILDTVPLFDFYRDMVRCINEYVKKVELASGLSVDFINIKKVEKEEEEDDDSDGD